MYGDFLNDKRKHQTKTAAGLLRELRELTPNRGKASFGDGPELTDRLYSIADLQDQFETYIEFQPIGGIPVTIGVVNWGWHGRAEGSYTTSIWLLTAQSITGPSLDADDDSFPEFPHTYHNSN
jgi:hypothetical protein